MIKPTKKDIFLKNLTLEYQKNGFNIKQAYKKLKPKVKDSTAEVEGSKTLKDPIFKGFLREEREKAETRHGVDMYKLVSSLKDISKNDKNTLHRLKAIDMLIKIAGGYAPIKNDTNIKGEIQTNNPEMIEATNNLAKAIKSKKLRRG